MVSFSTSALLTLPFSMLTNGLTIPKDDSLLPKTAARDDQFLKLDFSVRSKHDNSIAVGRHLMFEKRSEGNSCTVSSPLVRRDHYWYSIDLFAGSSKQKVTVLLDTGSSDLWVVSSEGTCAYQKNEPEDYCKTSGVYDQSRSNTFQSMNKEFSIFYSDGRNSIGTWGIDDFSLASGPTIKGVQFATVNSTSVQHGVLGIGFVEGESFSKPDPYDNFPRLLKNQGLISKIAYSFFLNSREATSGSVIFGGIDNAKYEGELTTLPVAGTELTIELGDVQVGSLGTVEVGDQALLDSGTTLIWVNPVLFDQFRQLFNATWSDKEDGYTVSCEQPDEYVTFNFAKNTQIKVPFSEIASPLYTTQGNPTGSCYFGFIKGKENHIPILGDNFMRSAYIVYDLEDREISIAQAKYTSESEIVPIQ